MCPVSGTLISSLVRPAADGKPNVCTVPVAILVLITTHSRSVCNNSYTPPSNWTLHLIPLKLHISLHRRPSRNKTQFNETNASVYSNVASIGVAAVALTREQPAEDNNNWTNQNINTTI